MRKYEKEFRNFLRECIVQYRIKNRLSQEKMAEILHISLRSYAGQERGEYGYSSQTLMFFIYRLTQEEREKMVERFEKHLKDLEGEAIA